MIIIIIIFDSLTLLYTAYRGVEGLKFLWTTYSIRDIISGSPMTFGQHGPPSKITQDRT